MSATSTPLMDQYRRIKDQYQDAILFFRLGDFYEMFFEDAKIAARELEITLTARGKDSGEPVPLAGIPYHSYQAYASKLLRRGYKVALCEQMSDPKASKGIVERQVVRVLTPGTLTEDQLLAGVDHNYLLAMARRDDRWALAFLDVSTGDAYLTNLAGEDGAGRIHDEVLRIAPRELVLTGALREDPAIGPLVEALGLSPGAVNVVAGGPALLEVTLPEALQDSWEAVEPEKEEALRLLVAYLARTQSGSYGHFSRLTQYSLDDTMVMDPGTVRNLELIESMRDKGRRGTLLWAMDRTATPMGGRLMRRWLLYPLLRPGEIDVRLDAVEQLCNRQVPCRDLAEALTGVYDMPRILAKLAGRSASPRDLVHLAASLGQLPAIRSACEAAGLSSFAPRLEDFASLREHLGRALAEPAPLTAAEGGIFREGYHGELDRLRSLDTDAKGTLARLEEAERDSTGIRSMRIKYNRVIGYFLEVSKSNLPSVPAHYMRKQGMAGGERFVTPELKQLEVEILQAQERAIGLEQELFALLREEAALQVSALKAVSHVVAQLDVLASFAIVAMENNYVRPRFGDRRILRIEGARHPVVERMLGAGAFVPNDLVLDLDVGPIAILTGPNMAGKSTYLRQAALLTIMAQMGSFVPATTMQLDVVDKVFTRVGASDDLASGQSTFMVEMKETATILRGATDRSLLILDEVGRGTATYDGLSLAWAIVEHLHKALGRPRTLFATHYHELTELAALFPGIRNLSTQVLEKGDQVVFLHKVGPGAADKSYGIHVARLAGLPDEVLSRAREILFELEQDEERDLEKKRRKLVHKRPQQQPEQLLLFDRVDHPVVDALRKIDVNQLTPLQALNLLAQLRAQV